jgi:hypothetical protein
MHQFIPHLCHPPPGNSGVSLPDGRREDVEDMLPQLPVAVVELVRDVIDLRDVPVTKERLIPPEVISRCYDPSVARTR